MRIPRWHWVLVTDVQSLRLGDADDTGGDAGAGVARRLAEVVRFGQGLLHLSQPGVRIEDAPGYLMAARDEEPPPPPEPGKEP